MSTITVEIGTAVVQMIGQNERISAEQKVRVSDAVDTRANMISSGGGRQQGTSAPKQNAMHLHFYLKEADWHVFAGS
eukprot:1145463-Pyramimonas_sp.AAC.1